MPTDLRSDARAAYDELADDYDAFTADYAYEPLLSQIDALARRYGSGGRALLDVGCGTGKSFLPMLGRGYDIVACDISPRMVGAARRKVGLDESVEVKVADMRSLPRLGAFDVVTCIDDAVNYLLDEDDLRACFRGVRENLAAGGCFVFDVNTLRTYRTAFTAHEVVERDDAVFVWQGRGEPDPEPGALASATLDVFRPSGDDAWTRRRSFHIQRHFGPHEIAAALADAGLECADVRGQLPGARLESEPDEDRHGKLLYVTRPAVARRTRRARLRPVPRGAPRRTRGRRPRISRSHRRLVPRLASASRLVAREGGTR